MAKSDNFFNITGRLGDFIFYNRGGKTYVKRYSGGFTKKETQEHPKVRVAQERFGEVARFVKSFKQGLAPYLWRQKDGSFHNQLMALFSQMSKTAPEKFFRELLQTPESYQSLKNKSLNKNSKIKSDYLTFDSKTNTLTIGMVLYELSQKYKGMFLEVATGWYGVSEGQAYLTLPVLEYLKLEATHPQEQITLDFAVCEDKISFLPFVGLSVVYKDCPESSSPHPIHTVSACFV